MDADYPTGDEPATPDYILAVFQDAHRQGCHCAPEVDLDAVLTFDTTVAEWTAACDLVTWRELGRAYNREFGIDIGHAEWRAAFTPARTRRLAGVCELIARHARRPVVRPARVFGAVCAPAGAFLTARSLLRDAGADVGRVAPSTPLDQFTLRHADVFLGPVARLTPGALPPIRVVLPELPFGGWSLATALVGVGLGCAIGPHSLAAAGGLLLAIHFIANSYAARGGPTAIAFGELRTFRDLAVVLAQGAA